MSFCLAIDIGGTKIASALVSPTGKLTKRCQIATPQSSQQNQLKDALMQIINYYPNMANQIAVASTGIINQGNLTALNPFNLGGLNNFPLANVIKELSHLPVTLLNDAQAASWAEYTYISSQNSDIKNMAFITVSTGVGGGLISNGKLLTGQHGIAGHIGHTLSDPNGPKCGCGRQGCVEAIASGKAISAMATEDLTGFDSKKIFELANNGHKQASILMLQSANTIAQLIADLKMSFDIDCCVIGGSVGLAENYLLQVNCQLQLLPTVFQTPLFAAHYQQNAGLLGAAMWALDSNY